jgi:hypothetical protein
MNEIVGIYKKREINDFSESEKKKMKLRMIMILEELQ